MCKCPFTKSETFTKCYNKKEASAEDDKGRRWTNDQGTSAIVGHRWEIGDLSLSLRMTTCSLESFFSYPALDSQSKLSSSVSRPSGSPP